MANPPMGRRNERVIARTLPLPVPADASPSQSIKVITDPRLLRQCHSTPALLAKNCVGLKGEILRFENVQVQDLCQSRPYSDALSGTRIDATKGPVLRPHLRCAKLVSADALVYHWLGGDRLGSGKWKRHAIEKHFGRGSSANF